MCVNCSRLGEAINDADALDQDLRNIMERGALLRLWKDWAAKSPRSALRGGAQSTDIVLLLDKGRVRLIYHLGQMRLLYK
jgi:hypothetical protein